jgi:S1-C subfamily serine protease
MNSRPFDRQPGAARLLTVSVCVLAGVVSVRAGQQVSAAPQTPASGAATCQEALPDLYKRVAPSIVLIEATSIDQYDPLHRMERVSGSGVIVDPRGLILTNSHVVFGRAVMTVTLDDGTTARAEPVGADPLYDIALIRIVPPSTGKLQAADLGDSDRARVGDEVYAIGNPLGLNRTLTRGIVSAVNRLLPSAAWSINEPLIQTDAAINPGNSGGPLYDRCGQVIGITTAILPDAQSIGFAIPSNLIQGVMPSLLEHGRLIRPWLGVQGQFVPPALKRLLRIPLANGFLVEAVEPGSPAEKAGVRDGEFELTLGGAPILLGGDIITEVNGSKLDGMDKLDHALSSLTIGGSIQLTVFRDNKTVHLDIGIIERPIMPWDLPGRQDDIPTPTSHTDAHPRPWIGTAPGRRISF